MSAPVGTNTQRWNQLVNKVAQVASVSQAAADIWLNLLYTNPAQAEDGGQIHEAVKTELEERAKGTDIPTLPRALHWWVDL